MYTNFSVFKFVDVPIQCFKFFNILTHATGTEWNTKTLGDEKLFILFLDSTCQTEEADIFSLENILGRPMFFLIIGKRQILNCCLKVKWMLF